MEDLRVSDALTIPANELVERFTTSGGPGGQHANRSATRVVLSFDIASSGVFDDAMRQRLIENLAPRLTEGVLSITADESRSQWRNRQIARRRLGDLIVDNLRPPSQRVPTKPTRAARRRRLDDKKARGRVKRLRRRPDLD
jgi:ribosome-associated protein